MEGMEMSDYYEYYMNNPHEIPSDMEDDNEWLQNEIEDAADKDTFVYDLLADEYVDFDVTKATLRAMFKSYCKRMHSTKKGAKEEADADLLIFAKSLMAAMYLAAEDIVIGRNE
jgi:hypothetical protein